MPSIYLGLGWEIKILQLNGGAQELEVKPESC